MTYTQPTLFDVPQVNCDHNPSIVESESLVKTLRTTGGAVQIYEVSYKCKCGKVAYKTTTARK